MNVIAKWGGAKGDLDLESHENGTFVEVCPKVSRGRKSTSTILRIGVDSTPFFVKIPLKFENPRICFLEAILHFSTKMTFGKI